jgi:UPF0755 protein
MTIRGGRRPRGDLSQAHPSEPDRASESASSSDRVLPRSAAGRDGTSVTPRIENGNHAGARANGRYSNGAAARYANNPRRRRGRGFVRFLLFTGILAALVIATLLTVLRPVLANAVVGYAYNNPSALRLPLVADLVREDLGTALTDAPSTDGSTVQFTIEPGDTPQALVPRLKQEGLIGDERAFIFTAIEMNLGPKLVAGTYLVRRNMTPAELTNALVEARMVTIPVTFREGLRLEQITAKLETIQGTGVKAQDFYDLVTKPPSSLLDAYPWLRKVLPKGATLEGFLYPATYTLRPDSTAEELVRMMLDAFHEHVGDQRLAVDPKKRGLGFYQVLALASIVEREAQVDEERPLIAGVYQNRLNPKLFPLGMLQSDPTIFYVNDSLQLRNTPLGQWLGYTFWSTLKEQLPATLPADLAAYNTYTHKGLPPGPICSPTTASIDAALTPNTKTGYLYFIAKNDGSGTSAFARTAAEHEANKAKYGQP